MYSRRVKLIVLASGLCFSMAFRKGLQAVLEISSYDNEMRLVQRVGGYSDESMKHSYSVSARLDYVHDEIFQCVIFGGAGVVGLALAKLLARVERGAEQEQRNRLAEQLAAAVENGDGKDGEVRPFALYLRPFALESSLYGWISGTGSKEAESLESGAVTFDRFLQEHLNYLDIPLIRIGIRRKREGAGHVLTSDVEWCDRFRKLADRAAVIFVVPGMSDGILEEVHWLMGRGLLTRTVFFQPKGYPRAAWQQVKTSHKEKEGLGLPEYSAKQVSFRLDSSGRCFDVETWIRVSGRPAMRRSVGQMRALLGRVSPE
jgi:hypothetical protein